MNIGDWHKDGNYYARIVELTWDDVHVDFYQKTGGGWVALEGGSILAESIPPRIELSEVPVELIKLYGPIEVAKWRLANES